MLLPRHILLKHIHFHFCLALTPSPNITTIYYNRLLVLLHVVSSSLAILQSMQSDCRLTNLREIYRLFHYRLDTGYISDRLSVPVKQWHIRHTTSNVVFLVLTGISWGFSSWCFEDPAILVRPLSSQVLAIEECVCVSVWVCVCWCARVCVLACIWVYSPRGSTMEAWQH